MKKTNMYCRLGFHQYRWDWRKLCHTCMNCGAVKTGLFNTIKNIVLWFAVVYWIIQYNQEHSPMVCGGFVYYCPCFGVVRYNGKKDG